MNPDQALAKLAKQAGILPTYRNLAGINHPTSPDTMSALLRAAGWQIDNAAMINEALKDSQALNRARNLPDEVVLNATRPMRLHIQQPGEWQLVLEGVEDVYVSGRAEEKIDLPLLPLGIHQLVFKSGKNSETVRVIVAPASAPSVEELTKKEKLWGVNLALYGLHSKRNPGIGDYEDLKRAALSFAAHGADFVGINPVHAIGWNSKEVISPYSPSHRGYLNTRHLALDQIAPASEKTKHDIKVWQESTKTRQTKKVDYAGHIKTHQPLLLALYEDFKMHATSKQKAAFRKFSNGGGASLQRYATYESLTELHGNDWRTWPSALNNPSNIPHCEEVNFHSWLQWHAEMQLQSAQNEALSTGMSSGLYLDLAVGSRRDGAEAWTEQNSVAEGVSIGAPPDHLSPAGQNWNLTAFAPQKLAATDYGAFRSILASNMRHCGILRIDHVLGLSRSFWMPDDGTPGGYIKQNFEALLAIIRIEAARHNTIIIGEDLGLVPSGFRKALQDSGIYSYSVLQYEKTRSGAFRKPSALRRKSLACFGTHDTPTLAGFAYGRDIDWWEKLGWINKHGAKTAKLERQQECEQLGTLHPKRASGMKPQDDKGIAHLSENLHTALANSPVSIVAVQLDDIEGKLEAQNLPGTTDEHPNWKRRSGLAVENLMDHNSIKAMSSLMLKSGRGSGESEEKDLHHEE